MSGDVLVLDGREVERLIDPDALVDAVAAALAALSSGEASAPPRVAATVAEHDGWLGGMLAYLPGPGMLAAKLVSLYPGNAAAGLPTHHALVAAFDPATGRLRALLDGTSITAARTAAVSALATRLLARPDSSVLAVLGTGVQARSHARALVRVRPVRELRVCGRDRTKTVRLASELADELGLDVRPVERYEDALRAADVVCAATHSPDPVVRRRWLAAGTHVNSVGYNTAGREVDAATVVDSLVAVESRAAALAPPPAGSNDLAWPIRDGLLGADFDPPELGELVLGRRAGRTDAAQLTLYKSVGVAVEDAAAAALVLAAAEQTGAGVTIRL